MDWNGLRSLWGDRMVDFSISQGETIVHSREESARICAAWRAAGVMPPKRKAHEYVRPEYRHVVKTKFAVSLDPCDLLGEIIHEEPCTCGAAKKIAVHECQHADNKRASGANGLCVPLRSNVVRIKDQDARLSLLCCESCPLRCVTPHPSANSSPELSPPLDATQIEPEPAQ